MVIISFIRMLLNILVLWARRFWYVQFENTLVKLFSRLILVFQFSIYCFKNIQKFDLFNDRLITTYQLSTYNDRVLSTKGYLSSSACFLCKNHLCRMTCLFPYACIYTESLIAYFHRRSKIVNSILSTGETHTF